KRSGASEPEADAWTERSTERSEDNRPSTPIRRRYRRCRSIEALESAKTPNRWYLRRMGVLGRLSSERAVDLSVHASASGSDAPERLLEVGRALHRDGADTVILGCAGMAAHREMLESAIGCPVIDPTLAAVAMALGRVLSG
ncbi:MAG: aspartate/glutamate racemase family protein, partial [Pseudomonadota bacterium]